MNRVRAAAPWITRRLRVGLPWLWDHRQQKRGALIQHHGVHSRAGRCGLGICPAGADNMPVVVLEISAPRIYAGPLDIAKNVLTEDEVASFRTLLLRAAPRSGVDVKKEWNDAGCLSGSFMLTRRAGAAVLELVRTYHKGCPDYDGRKHSLLCGWDGCPWFGDGYGKARLPRGWR